MKQLLLLVAVIMLIVQPQLVNAQKKGKATAKPTVVYIVRHAEKVTSDPADRDPDLTDAGKERAEELTRRLKEEPIAAVYTTNYKRTRHTIEPLAKAKNVTIQEYDVKQPRQLVSQVLENNKGQTVVVAGHSNTLLELIEAFGSQRPISTIDEDEYYYLFRLEIAPGQKPVVSQMKYGNTTRTSN